MTAAEGAPAPVRAPRGAPGAGAAPRASGAAVALSAALGLAATHAREVGRQPVYGVLLLLGGLAVALSPALAVFALGEADALVVDLGAGTTLFFCVFLAATVVASGTAERVGDGTLALVLTRPVSPLTCLVGAFLGAAVALLRAGLLLGVLLLAAARNGPDRVHWGVAWPLALAALAAFAWAVRASLGGRHAQAAALGAATWLLPLAYLAGLALGPDGRPLGAGSATDAVHGTAAVAALFAAAAGCTFAALGVALATRLAPPAAATLTLLAFLLGSLVQPAAEAAGESVVAAGVALALAAWAWLLRAASGLGPLALALAVLAPLGAPWLAWREPARGAGPLALGALGLALVAVGRTFDGGGAALGLLVPDLQLYWVGDAIYRGALVPIDYVARVLGYSALYCVGALGLAAALLEGRELGTS